jgi:hypothetical protein
LGRLATHDCTNQYTTIASTALAAAGWNGAVDLSRAKGDQLR